MLLGLGISILFGHSEIDYVNYVGGLGRGSTDEEIIRFDISIDEILFVNDLHSRQLRRRSWYQFMVQEREVKGGKEGEKMGRMD